MNQNQAICILREGFVEDIEDIEIMIIICENLYFPFQRFCKIEEWLLRWIKIIPAVIMFWICGEKINHGVVMLRFGNALNM